VADSYRLVVLKALTAHLETITVANGYSYDLSAAVFRGRTVFGANDPETMVSILEAPRNDSGIFAGSDKSSRAENWNLLVQGWAPDDKANPTDPAYGLMDAVETHLFRLVKPGSDGNPLYPDEYLLGRTNGRTLIADMKIFPGVVRPPMEQVSSKAFFYLPVELQLVRQ
jgi:hypothetical protein